MYALDAFRHSLGKAYDERSGHIISLFDRDYHRLQARWGNGERSMDKELYYRAMPSIHGLLDAACTEPYDRTLDILVYIILIFIFRLALDPRKSNLDGVASHPSVEIRLLQERITRIVKKCKRFGIPCCPATLLWQLVRFSITHLAMAFYKSNVLVIFIFISTIGVTNQETLDPHDPHDPLASATITLSLI